jgi:hypothetical protein
MKLNLTPFHFEEVIRRSYSIDLVILLMMIHENLDISILCEESAKIKNMHDALILKGLISETEDKITTLGTELLVFMDSKEPKRMTRKKADPTAFEAFWLVFPGTDTFNYKGVSFTGARSLRCNKEACRLKFYKIILEGEYTADIIVSALKYDVLQKKESSIKTHTNKLSYMQNSLTYLNQLSFEPFIELIKDGVKIQETYVSRGGIDI